MLKNLEARKLIATTPHPWHQKMLGNPFARNRFGSSLSGRPRMVKIENVWHASSPPKNVISCARYWLAASRPFTPNRARARIVRIAFTVCLVGR